MNQLNNMSCKKEEDGKKSGIKCGQMWPNGSKSDIKSSNKSGPRDSKSGIKSVVAG
ncbi:hypothetical protein PIROE2DRAFT_14633 [Piromyces sp. E2]|nr:hypothetical protein PIROE2DRAFT_14633 [Piromyces sp. E2]|eukprot:OUM59763.1 hypothetical protein PIROE2DRAFT_14633 [Piromyces sp. E2]